jgi:hypothetical protein
MITIDADGYMFYWEYDNQYFNLRKKGFIPKVKYHVLTNGIIYEPLKIDEKKQFFPPLEEKLT